MLQHVNLPICKYPACADATTHRQAISDMYNEISKILKESSGSIIREGNLSHTTIAGWSEHVKEQHEAAREAFLLWKSSGKPRTGITWDMIIIIIIIIIIDILYSALPTYMYNVQKRFRESQCTVVMVHMVK